MSDEMNITAADMLEIAASGGNGSEYVDYPALMLKAAGEMRTLERRYTALVAALKTHAGDVDGWEFGLGRVRFDEHGSPTRFLWATQADIDSAIEAALAQKE